MPNKCDQYRKRSDIVIYILVLLAGMAFAVYGVFSGIYLLITLGICLPAIVFAFVRIHL